MVTMPSEIKSRKFKKFLIHVFQNIFQRKISKSILLNHGIHSLSLLDLIKLIWKDFQEKKEYDKYNKYCDSKNTTIKRFLNIEKLMRKLILPITALRGNLISVPIDLCTNKSAFSYGNQGWNWIKDLTTELVSQPDIQLEETRFFMFFQSIKCSSYTQFMTFHNASLMESLQVIPCGSYPWGHFDREGSLDLNRHTPQLCCGWDKAWSM